MAVLHPWLTLEHTCQLRHRYIWCRQWAHSFFWKGRETKQCDWARPLTTGDPCLKYLVWPQIQIYGRHIPKSPPTMWLLDLQGGRGLEIKRCHEEPAHQQSMRTGRTIHKRRTCFNACEGNPCAPHPTTPVPYTPMHPTLQPCLFSAPPKGASKCASPKFYELLQQLTGAEETLWEPYWLVRSMSHLDLWLVSTVGPSCTMTDLNSQQVSRKVENGGVGKPAHSWCQECYEETGFLFICRGVSTKWYTVGVQQASTTYCCFCGSDELTIKPYTHLLEAYLLPTLVATGRQTGTAGGDSSQCFSRTLLMSLYQISRGMRPLRPARGGESILSKASAI